MKPEFWQVIECTINGMSPRQSIIHAGSFVSACDLLTAQQPAFVMYYY